MLKSSVFKRGALRYCHTMILAALAGSTLAGSTACDAYDPELVDWEGLEAKPDGGAADAEGRDRGLRDSATEDIRQSDGGQMDVTAEDTAAADTAAADPGPLDGAAENDVDSPDPLQCIPNPKVGDTGDSCLLICPEVCDGEDNDCDGETDEAEAAEACTLPHATAGCVEDACAIMACDPLFGDCDATAADGCETPLNTRTDCGGCGVDCGPLRNATATCESGSCEIEDCGDDYDDCDRNPANGCETSLLTDQHCGTCDTVCSIDHASASCSSGTCRLEQCDPGYADCNGDLDNADTDGCETDVTVVNTDAIGRWRLDETSGLSAEDSSASANHGTLNNMDGTEWSPGVDGGALGFDGFDDYLDIGDVGADISTVTFWMKYEATAMEAESRDTGFVSCSATGDDYADWLVPELAYASDNQRATGSGAGQQDWHGFALNIPAGSTITGIEVRVEGDGGYSATGAFIELSWDGGVSYTNSGKAVLFDFTPGFDETQTQGASSDLWGRSSWSSLDFADDNFRVRLQQGFGVPGGIGVFIDQLQVRVSYLTPAVSGDRKVINLDDTAHVEVVEGDVNTVGFAGTTAIYVDGSMGTAIDDEFHHVAITSTVGIRADSLQVGKYAADPNHFLGLIDDLRIYDRVLTPTEIALLAGTSECVFGNREEPVKNP